MRGARRPAVTTAALLFATTLLFACGKPPAPGAVGSEGGSAGSSQGPVEGTSGDPTPEGSDLYPDGKAVSLEGDHFLWDVDGDGVDEEFFVSFTDNGDDAPSGIGLTAVTAGGTEVNGYIDGAYGLLDLWAALDGGRPVLVVSYYEGDFYSHENIDVCVLSLNGDELEVGHMVILDGPYGEA